MNSLINETGAEILKAIRAPEFLLPTLLMPCAFYSLFGVVLSTGNTNATYLLATYGVFAVIGPSIFGFGVGVANERDKGWLQLKQAVPAPAYSYVVAKIITTLLFACLALMPIYLIAGFFGGVELQRQIWFSLFGIHLISAIPFVLIGLSLGLSLNSGAAVAISNIVFLSLSVLGGLWFPVYAFPAIMQTIAKFTPSYHLAELALAIVGAGGEHASRFNLLSILIMSLALLGLAISAWIRQR
ncbi:MAG: ABC-2 type transport system permease protein [Arenicella sp.]|jgi:ABC-2 type transport system permease protein